jgi:hypothetical protein
LHSEQTHSLSSFCIATPLFFSPGQYSPKYFKEKNMKLKGWVLAIAFAAFALPLAKASHSAQKIGESLFDSSKPNPTWSEGNTPVPPWFEGNTPVPPWQARS